MSSWGGSWALVCRDSGGHASGWAKGAEEWAQDSVHPAAGSSDAPELDVVRGQDRSCWEGPEPREGQEGVGARQRCRLGDRVGWRCRPRILEKGLSAELVEERKEPGRQGGEQG